MQWYRYWAICEYSGVLTYSPQTCENLSVLEKEILKDGGITDWVHGPSMFYFSKLYCFLYYLFVEQEHYLSSFRSTELAIVYSQSAELRHTKDGCMSCILTSINMPQKKEDGIRWINRAVMFNIFWCGKTETKQNWKTTTKGKEVITPMKASWLDSILISFI